MRPLLLLWIVLRSARAQYLGLATGLPVDPQAVQTTTGTHPTVGVMQMTALSEYMDSVNAVPPNYYYLFPLPYVATIPAGETDLSLPVCGQIVSPGYVVFVLHAPNSLYGKIVSGLTSESVDAEYYNVPLTADGSVLGQLSDCDPVVTATCAAATVGSAYVANLQIWIPNVYSPGDPLHWLPPVASAQKVYSQDCMLMYLKDAGVKTCPNGYYASDYVTYNSQGFVSNSVECLPCRPGTWLTCNTGSSCLYQIPTRGSGFQPPNTIYNIADQVPVGKCFSCDTAGGGKEHYGGAPNAIFIGLAATTPLPWICPGGAEPPQKCNLTIYVGANANGSECVCNAGRYPAGGDLCVPCDPGYMCPQGERQECPDNSYQNLASQTSCVLCSLNGNASGVLIPCGPNQLLSKCVYPYKSVAPKCVGCNMCRRDYIQSRAGQVPCYT